MSHRYTPAAPWTLRCPWCEFNILVFARGAHGADEGSGVEAADLMQRHVTEDHARSWAEFLAASDAVRSGGGTT